LRKWGIRDSELAASGFANCLISLARSRAEGKRHSRPSSRKRLSAPGRRATRPLRIAGCAGRITTPRSTNSARRAFRSDASAAVGRITTAGLPSTAIRWPSWIRRTIAESLVVSACSKLVRRIGAIMISRVRVEKCRVGSRSPWRNRRDGKGSVSMLSAVAMLQATSARLGGTVIPPQYPRPIPTRV